MSKIHHIKEAIIAAAMIMAFTGLVSLLPLKFEFLKAIRQDVYGFDIYDLYYTEKNIHSPLRDSNIVIVQIADDRNAIADQINIIESHNPAVIGIDAYFDERRDDAGNLKFLQAIENNNNLVFGFRLDTIKNKPGGFLKSLWNEKSKLTVKHNFFDADIKNYKSGYINFTGNRFSVIRNYPPFLEVSGEEQPAFTSRIIQLYSPARYDTLKRRKHQEEIINYTGNTETYTCITKEELLEYDATGQLSKLFENKIILLGYLIKYPPYVLDDLHFSPLNEEFAGKSFPDIYGVVIHANILSMILNGHYAKLASASTSYLFAFSFTFLFLLYVIYLHSKKEHPAHAKILLIQFILILAVLYLFLQVYSVFLWKLPLLPILISLVLCIELLGIYKMLAIWLHKKTGYKTVFAHKIENI